MKTTQDDARENLQVKVFNLHQTKGRSNKYVHDAECTIGNKTYRIELKSCDASKNQVSTSREFGIKKINEWKTNHAFIFSKFEKTKVGIKLIKHIYCTPDMLQPFFDKVMKKLDSGVAGRAGLKDWSDAKTILENAGFEATNKIEQTVVRGAKLNDPRISWKNIESWGIVIDSNNPAKHLRMLLEAK